MSNTKAGVPKNLNTVRQFRKPAYDEKRIHPFFQNPPCLDHIYFFVCGGVNILHLEDPSSKGIMSVF